MKLKLKQVRYSPLYEALFLIICNAVFCGCLLYMILTGIKSPANTMIIVGFVFFGSGLLTGIWLFLKKKTSDVINVNGWQYKLFRKGNRFRFILISGLYKLHIVAITLLVIWFTVIQPDGDTSFNEILWYIAGSLIILIVLTPFLGYFEYKKFSSIDTGE